jgi:cytochrome d ubiquinol oxidase subunit II
MDLPSIWFLLVGFLIAGYAILDGFDLGVGVLSLFAKDPEERRIFYNAIGPVWDGNEVWLLTGGGALFAAFPIVYATVFSSFYLAMMLVVAALMARAVSFEFRGKLDSPRWRRVWDACFGLGSLIAGLLYGVTVGNVISGIPLDAEGNFTGSFFGLLDPYSLLLGLLSLSMFVVQGATYMCMKTEGELRERMRDWARNGWTGFAVLYAIATAASVFVAPHLFAGAVANPLFWIFTLSLVAGAVSVPLFSSSKQYGRAFLGSSLTILSIIGLAAVGMFPRLVVSSTALEHSLTIYNAASTPKTQTVMLIIALIGMPIVLAYTAYIYKVFKGKVVLGEGSY